MKRTISLIGVFLGFIFIPISAVYACTQYTTSPYYCDQLTVCYPTTASIKSVGCANQIGDILVSQSSGQILLQQKTRGGSNNIGIDCTIDFNGGAIVNVTQGDCDTTGSSHMPVLKVEAGSVDWTAVSSNKGANKGGAINITSVTP